MIVDVYFFSVGVWFPVCGSYQCVFSDWSDCTAMYEAICVPACACLHGGTGSRQSSWKWTPLSHT